MPPRLIPIRCTPWQVGWSLLAANGRLVASSVDRYGDDDALVRATRELMVGRHSLTFTVTRDDARTWWWTAFLPVRSTAVVDARPVARSGRGYLRQDQCRQGATTFVSALDQIRQDGRPLERLMNSG